MKLMIIVPTASTFWFSSFLVGLAAICDLVSLDWPNDKIIAMQEI